MNISGKWIGKYTYGREYSPSLIGKSEPFELDLMDNDGIIKGSCQDNLVSFIEGNEAQIMGSFNQKEISFKKRYKIQLSIDENGQLVQDDNMNTEGVDYVGRFYKKALWRNPCFKGTWSIKGFIEMEDGTMHAFENYGTWEMKRVG